MVFISVLTPCRASYIVCIDLIIVFTVAVFFKVVSISHVTILTSSLSHSIERADAWNSCVQ